MNKEPVLTVATVVSAGAAIITLLVAFGIDLTNDQTNAILGVLAVVAPLVVIVARKYVTPTTGGEHRADV